MNVPELNANGMEMGNGMKFFHVYTRGLEDDVIFRDRGDYVAGMNYVPVSIKLSEVHALAFVLMSNHFHFILGGTKESAEKLGLTEGDDVCAIIKSTEVIVGK